MKTASRRSSRQSTQAKTTRKGTKGGHRRLTKVGNSYAAIIPRDVLALLGMDEHSELTYSTDGKSLIISRVAADTDKAFRSALGEAVKEYREAIMVLGGR